jgi:hypothetical protein
MLSGAPANVAVQLSYLESLRDVMQAWAALSPYVSR